MWHHISPVSLWKFVRWIHWSFRKVHVCFSSQEYFRLIMSRNLLISRCSPENSPWSFQIFSLFLGRNALSWTVRRPTPSGPPARCLSPPGIFTDPSNNLHGIEISKVLPLGTGNMGESSYENFVVETHKKDFVFRPRFFPYRLQFSASIITLSWDTIFPRYPTFCW
jgi:hypothetical protein